MVGKDLAKRRLDLHSSVHLAPVEADDIAIGSEQPREISGAAFIPRIQ